MTLTTPEQQDADDSAARALHLHTLESLCADLISGRAVGVENGVFRLSTQNSRSILNWYWQRRGRWSARMSESDAESIADCVEVAPPEMNLVGGSEQPSKRRLVLKKIRAHRFGGLHSYGKADEPPEDFVFEPTSKITLFEGWNGSGKTSLLNAVVWCLTGELLRPQDAPSGADDEFECSISRPDDEGGQTFTTHLLSPVTPLPDPLQFMPDPNQKIPLDTWVELTFSDRDGNAFTPIRRTQSRLPNGKLSEVAPNLEELGCDPIAFKLASTMPALLQHIQVGSVSDLGRAVAELTGLSELVSLKAHTERAKGYISNKLIKKREEEIDREDMRFNEARSDLDQRIAEFPKMKPEGELPLPSADKKLEERVGELRDHFNKIKSIALMEAKSILGPEFDAEDENSRNDLEKNAESAKAALQHIGKLPSAARVGALGKIADDEKRNVREMIESIVAESSVLAKLVAEPDLATRKRLYAQVASWMNAQEITDSHNCQVCRQSLEGVIDPVTGLAVSQHIEEALTDNPDLIAQTVQEWADRSISKLSGILPAALVEERQRELPSSPVDLIRDAICVELFADTPFAGVLGGLQPETENTFNSEAAHLPEYVDPESVCFPLALRDYTAQLKQLSDRILRALKFADWRNSSAQEITNLFLTVVGKTSDEESQQVATPVDVSSPLSLKIFALHSIVEGASPISAAVSLCDRMESSLKLRRGKEKRIKIYNSAILGLNELEALGELASIQVSALQTTLDSSARAWREKIYHDPQSSGHKFKHTRMSVDGILDMYVGSDIISAPAQHVSNASSIRSSLIAFFLAFRDRVLKERGGLDLLLLDDPQELLDQHNRDKMASAIVALGTEGSQLLVTTYDRQFAQTLVSASTQQCHVAHYSIHPVNAQRSRLEVGPSVLYVDKKRTLFLSNEDDHDIAKDYANECRIFLETRLRDLFDDPIYPAYAQHITKPSFGDHLDHLRGLVTNPVNDLFRHSHVVQFANSPALKSDHECYKLLNDSHHSPEKVSYARVKSQAAALKELCQKVEQMHSAFRDWRWKHKLPTEVANDNLPTLSPIALVDRAWSVCPHLAAFTGGGAGTSSQEVSEDQFLSSWFSDKSLFYVRSENLGFALPAGAVAIVESAPSEGRDRNLVIARKKGETLARRLFRQEGVNGYALAAETPDPRQSPPTKLVGADEYSIHRIVGCLLLDVVPPSSAREAIEIEYPSLISEISAVYRLDKESAVPLALPGQMLLGGKQILPTEFAQVEGKIAALSLNDGSNYLKRVGAPISDAIGYARHFETIGGLGQSIILQTEEVEESQFDAPSITQARLAVGIIYEF